MGKLGTTKYTQYITQTVKIKNKNLMCASFKELCDLCSLLDKWQVLISLFRHSILCGSETASYGCAHGAAQLVFTLRLLGDTLEIARDARASRHHVVTADV